MQVIPVIDIRNAVVVRAIAGRRSDYQPLETPLATTSDPLSVAEGLMSLYAFDALYIADLDAIEARGNNRGAVHAIASRFPALRLWIDAGFRRDADAREWRAIETVETVFGSESLLSFDEFEKASNNARAILSLDFKGRKFLGPDALLFSPDLWPKRVIVMTLDRVGSGGGPDSARLAHIRRAAGERNVFAAGGVRNLEDLRALEHAGAAGALVASALHDGRLTRDDIMRLAEK